MRILKRKVFNLQRIFLIFMLPSYLNGLKKHIEQKQFFCLFFILFVTGLIFKLGLVFTLPVYHDVGWYISLANYHDAAYMNLYLIEHPPLGPYFYLIFLKLFGVKDYVIRLVPFLFSLLELGCMYMLTKKWFNKATAYYTVLLFSLTYFATINALSPEGDGSIMGLFSLLLLYYFYEHYRTKQVKYLLLASIFFGLNLLVKLRAILFFIPLLLYSYYKTRHVFKSMKDLCIVGMVSVVLFSLFPLLLYITNPSTFLTLLWHIISHNTGHFSIGYKITHPMIFLQVFVVLSLLYPCLFVKGIKKIDDKTVLLSVWFVSLFLILLAILPEGLASVYPRYISFLAPVVIILSAKGLESLKLNISHLKWIVIGILLFSVVLVSLNQSVSSYWYFATAAMGVVKVSKVLLISVFSGSVLLIIIYWLVGTPYKKKVISVFLLVNFAFNLVLISDPLIDRTHKQILQGFVDYYTHHTIKQPVFTWAEDIPFYLGIKGKNINLITNKDLKAYAQSIGYDEEGYYYLDLKDEISMKVLKEKGGTVFSLYYPLKYTLDLGQGRKTEYDYLQANCILLKSLDYKHGKGVIYEC